MLGGAQKCMHLRRSGAMMLGVPVFHEDSSRGGGMRSIGIALAVAAITAVARAGRGRAGEDPPCPEFERHQLHDELQFASCELPNHLCRPRAAYTPSQP